MAACQGYLGDLSRARGDFKKARECYQAAIELGTGKVVTNGLGQFYSNMGQVLYLEKQYVQAEEYLEKAVSCLKSHGSVSYTHLDVYKRQARYMGEETSYRIKNQNLIERLQGVPDEQRTARFVCAIAAAFPDGREMVVRGTIEGRIGYEERGENGFGYDPIFYLPERGMSTAELSPEDKNSISHRGNALRKMKALLEKEALL